MYRFNYFTEKANHVINLAITSAEELGHNYIGSEHLLLGILKEDAGLGAQAYVGVGVPNCPRYDAFLCRHRAPVAGAA